jgi:hypothetical protein
MLLELCLTVVIALLAFLIHELGENLFRPIERRFSRFAARRRGAVLTAFLLAVGLRLALLPVEPVPVPAVHDEFSYLLMADTFAHGRLTNPTPPLWQHFETFHENMVPTYCSKYFPAQGIFLAIGQVIFGHPFWGVVLSLGLMSAATCWAMQGWMPPGWAFLGAVLLTAHLGVFGYWANSYWGGSVAAIGGALALGALPRVKRKQCVRNAVVMAIGFVILANSRPYEGLVFSIPILVALVLFFRRGVHARAWARVALPLCAVMLVAIGCMCFYFWRTTGNPLVPPYAVYSARYDSVPFVPWKGLKAPPHYDNAAMQDFYLGFVRYQYFLYRNSPFASIVIRMFTLWFFFIGPALSLPFLAVCWVIPYGIKFRDFSVKTRELLLITMCGFLAIMPLVYFGPHYVAPVTCALYTLLMFCVRRVWLWKFDSSATGKSMVRVSVITCVLMLALRAAPRPPHLSPVWLDNNATPSPNQIERSRLLSLLELEHGKQLVIVRYSPDHSPHEEWVYNGADINNAKVVWARELDPAGNTRLIEYFSDRLVWLLQPDENPPRLSPYSFRSEGVGR